MQLKLQHPIELKCADRVLLIRRSECWPGIAEICDQGIPVLKITLSPDEPLASVLGTVGEFLAADTLPSSQTARNSGAEWECQWEPWEGRAGADGIVELNIHAKIKDIVTDHSIHRCVDTCIWTDTGDDVGHIEHWLDTEELLHAVRLAISDLLASGKEYLLKLRVEAPEGTAHMSQRFSIPKSVNQINREDDGRE